MPTRTKDGTGTKHEASSPWASTPKRPDRPDDHRGKTNNYFFTLLLTLMLLQFSASPSVRRNLSFEVGPPGSSPHSPTGIFTHASAPHTAPLLPWSALPREKTTSTDVSIQATPTCKGQWDHPGQHLQGDQLQHWEGKLLLPCTCIEFKMQIPANKEIYVWLINCQERPLHKLQKLKRQGRLALATRDQGWLLDEPPSLKWPERPGCRT